MAIFNQSTFSLVLLALISSTAYGDISYAQCKDGNSASDIRSNTGSTFDNDLEGSQRTTYGNLCGGTSAFTDNTSNADKNIDSRIGHPFAKLCDLIDRYPSVQNLMLRGHSPHTVFAPTDAAFAKVEGLIDRVNELRLLELHILPQARTTQDLRCGQTYRTLNTLQDRRNNQRSKTRCVSAMRSQQLGPGNTINGLRPTIGVPSNIFKKVEFSNQDNFALSVSSSASNANDRELFGEDIIACNGVIHVIDEVLLPGNTNDFRSPPYNTLGLSYTGEPHNHGYYNGAAVGGYYNGAAVGGYYNEPVVLPSPYYGARYYKGFKKGKKDKGFKGAKGYGPPPRRRPNTGYYFRNLQDAEEAPMSDAEFFGTNGLADIEAKIESVKDEFAEKPDETRKRRLEAMLEADGNIKV